MKVSPLFSKKARINIEKIDAFRQKCYNRLNDITRRGLTGDGQFVEIRCDFGTVFAV